MPRIGEFASDPSGGGRPPAPALAQWGDARGVPRTADVMGRNWLGGSPERMDHARAAEAHYRANAGADRARAGYDQERAAYDDRAAREIGQQVNTRSQRWMEEQRRLAASPAAVQAARAYEQRRPGRRGTTLRTLNRSTR
tara:strand:- start:355 stop:774 length:420 start_codon:yes stop_codon:yes gene_type:complete